MFSEKLFRSLFKWVSMFPGLQLIIKTFTADRILLQHSTVFKPADTEIGMWTLYHKHEHYAEG